MVKKIRIDVDVRDILKKGERELWLGDELWLSDKMVFNDDFWNKVWDDYIGEEIKKSIKDYVISKNGGSLSI